jgi:cell pole-organizing protein PopZ
MGRYLVVANQTLGGADLERTIRDRVERGAAHFHIVVPTIEPQDETPAWAMSGSESSFVPPEYETADKARRRAQHRLNQMVDKIAAIGGKATGEVGDSDPAKAVRAALESETFEEVIISTLPARLSRWLKMDLPSRVSRMTEVPVTTIEAEA